MRFSAVKRRKRPHLSRSSVLRLAWSDIAHRKAVSCLTVVAIAIAISISLLLNGYAYQIYRAQKAITSEEVPTVMTVACADATDQEQRFTENTLEHLRADPRISLVYPKIEINVTLRNADRTTSVVAEGVLPSDPRVADGRLCWRHRVSAPGAEGLVLSQRLFEKMGGAVIAGDANPDKLTVSVARTQDGKRQEDSVNLPVVGILRHQASECVLLPVETVQRLDLFCSHKANAIDDEKLEMHFPSAVAYVPQQQLKRAQEDAKSLGIDLQEAGGPFEYPDSYGPVWVPADEPVDSLAALMPWCRLYKHHTLQMNVAGALRLVAALPAGDPRWQEIDTSASAFRTLYAMHEGGAEKAMIIHAGKTCNIRRPLHGQHPFIAADYVCTEDTMRWLAFQPEACALNKQMVFVCTDSVTVAAGLQDALNGRLRASPSSFTWGVYELTKGAGVTGFDVARGDGATELANRVETHQPFEVQSPGAVLPPPGYGSGWGNRSLPQDDEARSGLTAMQNLISLWRTRYPSLEVEEIPAGFAELDDSGSNPVPPVVKIRFLPKTLFERLTQGKTTSSGSGSWWHRSADAIVVGEANNWLPHQPSISKVSLRVVDRIRISGAKRELWLSGDSRHLIKHYPAASGLALFGDDWRTWLQAHDGKQEKSLRRTIAAVCPAHFGILLAGNTDVWTQRLSKFSDGDTQFIDLCHVNSGTDQFVTLQSRQAGNEAIVKMFYPSLSVLDTDHFVERLYHAADAQKLTSLPPDEGITLMFPSAFSFLNAVKNTKGAGGLKPFEVLPLVRLAGFTVRDLSRPEGIVDDRLLAALAMTQPTFFKVEPELTMTCELAHRKVQVDGVDQTSVRQCWERLLSGRWPTKPDELLLPQVLCDDPNNPETTRRSVELIFVRGDTDSLVNRLPISLNIVGVYQGDATRPLLVSDSLVRNIFQWQKHQLIWNADASCFVKPRQIYEQQGHVRATVISQDVGALETLVREFERGGYRVNSALGQLKGLRQLARLLTGTTVAFSCGMLLIATFSIFVSGYSQIRTKTREVALYTSFGCEARDILRMFCYEGLIIGIAAFVVGASCVLFIEPLAVRRIFVKILNINLDAVVQGVIAIPWHAFALAFFVSLFFVMAGVLLPASKACRTETPGLELKKSE